MKITTATITQTASKELGKEEKTMYFLQFQNEKGNSLTINVGKKTYEEINKLKKEEGGK